MCTPTFVLATMSLNGIPSDAEGDLDLEDMMGEERFPSIPESSKYSSLLQEFALIFFIYCISHY